MIILDTHIWIWWNQDSPQLRSFQKEIIENSRPNGIGISTISLIEISRLVNRGRLVFPKPLNEWFSLALSERMFEKYQRFWIRPLNPPILGDFEPSSPQSWGARGAVREAVSTFQTTSEEGVFLIPITPAIAIESYSLPGEFHKDPADRIIVATARTYDCSLITGDSNILSYPHVKLINTTTSGSPDFMG